MAVTYYSWDDAGAPQYRYISGTASPNFRNTIIEVLDAILINGYSSKKGLGWTKEMTSSVPGSNRTVYKNKSAHQDDMYLIVESDGKSQQGFKMQIADMVSSPEIYSGYSQIAAVTQRQSGVQRWHAVGDERTFIFVFYSEYVDNLVTRFWNRAGPVAIYVGDFDVPANSNPKAWGLVCNTMYQGTLDNEISYYPESHASFNLQRTVSNQPNDRPVTQIPGEAWSNDNVHSMMKFIMADTLISYNDTPKDVDKFIRDIQFRAEVFQIINKKHVYRMRGVYSFFPWLNQAGNSTRNFYKKITVQGDDYLTLKRARNANDVINCFVKTTGDW